MPQQPSSQVGVVIPVYNRANILIETLSFVLAQSLPPSKLIIADDGSTDGTADKVEEWLTQQAPSFEWSVLRLEKGTAAKARVAGFEAVRECKYVAFLDSDDHWPADFLKRTVTALEKLPTAVVATTDRTFNYSNNESNYSTGGADIIDDPITWFFEHGAGISSCSLLRTQSYLAMGGWNVDFIYSEDVYLFSLMALEGDFTHASGLPTTFNRGNADNTDEEDNLSRRYTDAETRWVKQLEKLYALLIQKPVNLNRKALGRAIAKRWYSVGRSQRHLKDYRNAQFCFKQSLRWHPYKMQTWLRYLKAMRKARKIKA